MKEKEEKSDKAQSIKKKVLEEYPELEDIMLNNIGTDDESVHQYEWLSRDKWYKF